MWCSMGATDGNPAGSHAVSPVTRTLAVSHRRDRGLTRHPVASTGIPWCPASAPCICHGRPWASVVFSRGSRWDFAVTRMGANGSSHGIPCVYHEILRGPTAAFHGIPLDFLWNPTGSPVFPPGIPRDPAGFTSMRLPWDFPRLIPRDFALVPTGVLWDPMSSIGIP